MMVGWTWISVVVALAVAWTPHAALGESAEDGCVVVTGATGFVAGHVIKVLLEKGYTVHGTVRSLADERKAAHLRALEANSPGTLVLFEAQLDQPDPFRESSKGCWGMLHLATAVISPGMQPAMQVSLAVNGTVAALNAAQFNNMKAVVVTASTATVFPSKKKLESREPSNENDWNDVATAEYGTYAYSKTQAERRANAFVRNLGEKATFRFSTIHFPLGLGPQLDNRVTSSNGAVQVLLRGSIPFALPMQWSVVDVRDVANAHVHVLEHSEAQGRYIVAADPKSGSSLTLLEMADLLRKHLPNFPLPSVEAPFWFARLIASFDGRIDKYGIDLAETGRHPGYDGSRIVRELGFKYEYVDVERTLVDTAQSFLSKGLADGKRHLMPAIYAIVLVPAALAAVVLALCCCNRAPQPKRKED